MDEDFTFSKQKEYIDKLILDLTKEGMSINEIMKMPFQFMIDLLEDRNKPEPSSSFFDLLG